MRENLYTVTISLCLQGRSKENSPHVSLSFRSVLERAKVLQRVHGKWNWKEASQGLPVTARRYNRLERIPALSPRRDAALLTPALQTSGSRTVREQLSVPEAAQVMVTDYSNHGKPMHVPMPHALPLWMLLPQLLLGVAPCRI